MRKNYLSITVAVALISSILFSSCIGSFSMTKKLLAWNNQVGNKFVNELVFFAFWILPVYEVSALADILVLNSIEFWSGTNPIARGTKIIEGHDGRYLVEYDGKGYNIKAENDGSVVRLDFNTENKMWSVITPDGTEYPLMTYIDDNHISLPSGDDKWVTVELSRNGVMAYSGLATSSIFASR